MRVDQLSNMHAISRSEFRFFHRLRVRWAEVDMQKIVFNAHYLMYFDTAMSDYWRALALPYDTTLQALQGDLYVKKASIEFHASARVDDQLDVALRCQRIGTSSMAFSGAIFRGEKHLISCEMIYVFADPTTQTARPVPTALRDILLGFEAGESMIQVELGSWQALGADARLLRAEVFVKEQGIDPVLACDACDEAAVQAVVRNRMGLAVATGRLLQHEPGVGRIGRMAVHRMVRGSGLGRELLQALMRAATQRGDRELLVHAQRSAEGFFQRQGFLVCGEPFEEAGTEHIEMRHPVQSDSIHMV